jgi:hypothetical protein
VIIAVPLLRVVDVFSENEPIPDWGKPVVVGGVPEAGVATSDTGPVAAEGATVTVKLTGFPCVIFTVPEAGLVIVTVSGVNEAEPQALIRFPTFSEPRPVAKS